MVTTTLLVYNTLLLSIVHWLPWLSRLTKVTYNTPYRHETDITLSQMSKSMTTDDEKGPTLFHHYLSILVPLLETPHRRQTSAIMQCFGHLAYPCKVILGEKELILLFKKILVAGLFSKIKNG